LRPDRLRRRVYQFHENVLSLRGATKRPILLVSCLRYWMLRVDAGERCPLDTSQVEVKHPGHPMPRPSGGCPSHGCLGGDIGWG